MLCYFFIGEFLVDKIHIVYSKLLHYTIWIDAVWFIDLLMVTYISDVNYIMLLMVSVLLNLINLVNLVMWSILEKILTVYLILDV